MLKDLPDDILRLVFAKCSGTTLASLECTCQKFRHLIEDIPISLHLTPGRLPTREWTDRHRANVTKVCVRRANPYVLHIFPNLTVIDIMYTRVRNETRLICPHLKKLRVCTLTRGFGQSGVFRTSSLPPTLEDVFLSFDTSWRRVEIDTSFPRMAFRCRPGQGLLRQPDFHVVDVSRTKELYLKTYGCITTSVSHPTPIEKTVIECHDNFVCRGVMRWFGRSLTTCVIRMPAANFVFSQDLAHVDPRRLDITGALVVVDVINPHLRILKINAARFASTAIPPEVDADITVDGRRVH